MLRAGLAVLIAELSRPPTETEQRLHGSTAYVFAASATTGGRNAPDKACFPHRQAKQVCNTNKTETAWLDSLRVRRKRGYRRQECSRQGSLFSSPA